MQSNHDGLIKPTTPMMTSLERRKAAYLAFVERQAGRLEK
jgi:hypothetical protein